MSYLVHIVTDEKFIDMAYRQFEEAAPGIHKFLVINRRPPLEFIAETPITHVDLAGARSIVADPECVGLILHSLDPGLKVLDNIPPGKKVIWLGWGFDYYERLLKSAFPDGLLLSKTSALWNEVRTPRSGLAQLRHIASSTRRILERVTRDLTGRSDYRRLQRVDCFSPVLDSEYDLIRRLNPWFDAGYLCWNYGTAEDDLEIAATAPFETGNDVLVGNSATPTNNHLEAFDILERCPDLGDSRIVVPLGYGEPRYRDAIMREGVSRFGSRFYPLVDFMPKSEYMTLLGNCGYVVMNQLRQQALGNICIAFLLGSKVFVNARSPLYAWLRSRGAVISAVPVDPGRSSNSWFRLQPLTAPERRANRDMVFAHWGREASLRRTQSLVRCAFGERSE